MTIKLQLRQLAKAPPDRQGLGEVLINAEQLVALIPFINHIRLLSVLFFVEDFRRF